MVWMESKERVETEVREEGEKKRFFSDELESSQESLPKFNQMLDSNSSFLFSNGRNDDEIEVPKNVEPIDVSSEEEPEESAKHISVDDLRGIIPDIPINIAKNLCEKYSGQEDGISRAVSQYFEDPPVESKSTTPIQPPEPTQRSLSPRMKKKDYGYRSPKRLKPSIMWRRFIGSLQVNAMATRPTIRPLKYSTELKIAPVGGNIKASKLYNSSGSKKAAFASFVKVFDVQQNREIGRVPEDIAQILYPILTLDDFMFEATMIFCDDKRLSIGDNFIVQLDCFITSAIFHESTSSYRNNSFAKNSRARTWEGSQTIVETEEEIESRSRRMSLLALFDKLRVRPVTNDNNSQQEAEVINLEDDGNPSELKKVDNEHELLDDQHPQEDTMNLNQLQLFYKATQSVESLEKLPEMEPPRNTFKLTLRRYQKQGLAWMLKREHEFDKIPLSESDQEIDENMMNPLWNQFEWPKDMSWAAQKMKEGTNDELGNDDRFFYANLHTAEFSTEKPVLKTTMKGGILSDEMGLGKTISTLSLILTAPNDSEYLLNEKGNEGDSEYSTRKPYAAKTTLIVVPMSLLAQWSSEFDKANSSSQLHSEVYYGGNVSSLKTLLTRTKNPPTVVLTTYGIVQNEWSKISRGKSSTQSDGMSGLFSIEFHRIVIDEGHTIRNRMTATSKAVMQLASKCRWVLTGTPIINRLDDLYSLVKFLRLEPWSQIGYWKMFISDPFEKKNFKQAFDVVNAILGPVSLRRTKQMKDASGKKLVELPPKEVVVEKLHFSKEQEKVYKYFLDRAESSVKSGLAHGDLLKKYSTILVHILRLRQICCDAALLGTQDENDEDLRNSNQQFNESIDVDKILGESKINATKAETDIKAILANVQRKYPSEESFKNLECSICTTEPINLQSIMFIGCGHCFCGPCLEEFMDFQKQKKLELRCPNCRELFDSQCLLSLRLQEEREPTLVPYNQSSKPAKIHSLVKHLRQLQDKSAGEQIVVFSQFSSYLDVLERELTEVFSKDVSQIYKFDGRLNLKERSGILRDFSVKDLSKQKILLLSLKAGGVGLNLTCASYAFMMDPWWSPSMEDQAIDRIHRIGQTNNVRVIRFIMENSIEEKMLRIQERKRTIGEAMDADEDERRKRRIEEIKMLFE